MEKNTVNLNLVRILLVITTSLIVFFIKQGLVLAWSGNPYETCGGFICGSCPSSIGSVCGGSNDWCCCYETCYCNCNDGQCSTGTGWDSQCPSWGVCCGAYGPSPTPSPTPRPTSTPTPRPTSTSTPTVTPTTAAGQCGPPSPYDPPTPTCDGGSGGQIRWRWGAVWDPDASSWVTQYEVDIYNSGGSLVINNGWQNASVFGCASGGTCQYVTTLSAGTYYSRVRARGVCSNSTWSQSPSETISLCSGPTNTPTSGATATPTSSPTPSCTVNLIPSSASVMINGNVGFSASVNASNGTVDRVRFSVSDSSVATLSRTSDSTAPYTTTATGQSAGAITVRAQVVMGGVVRCSDTSSLTVVATICPTPSRPVDPPTPWCTGYSWSNTWQWNAVWDPDAGDWVSQYRLQVDDGASFTTPFVYDSGWRNASFFGCAGGGSCSYTTSGLTSGVTYRSRIRARGLCAVSSWSDDAAETLSCASCSFNLSPATADIDLFASRSFIVSGLVSVGTIDRVDFSSSNPAIATVNPASDASVVYQTTVTGVSLSPPQATIRADMIMEGVITCSDTSVVSIVSPNPWWQGKEGDVMSGADISSPIPSASGGYFEDVIVAGGEGVPAAAGLSVSWGGGSGPNAGDVYVETSRASLAIPQVVDFRSKLPGSVTPTSMSGLCSGATPPCTVDQSVFDSGGVEYPAGSGYFYYEYDGSQGDLVIRDGDGVVSINAANSNRKVVVFVTGADVLVESKIRITRGTGGFYMLADGDISVDPSVGGLQEESPCDNACVPDLEGLYLAEGDFVTGTNGGSSDVQLHLRGSVVADNVNLQRDLPNNAISPSELFEDAPDLLMNFPPEIGEISIQWKEVSP